jgi:lysyl-tRNA synthetase, class II
MTLPQFDEIIEQNDQTAARREHLERLREIVGNVYPNRFDRSTLTGKPDTISGIVAYPPVAAISAEMQDVKSKLKEGERPPAEIKDALNAKLKEFGSVRIAGRLTTPPRGNFVHLTDGMERLQIYCKKGTFSLVKNDGHDTLDEENAWTAWGLIDHGDFVGVDGYLFVTNTGEVSLHVEKLQFLAKAMLPMPDKMHGIADPEIRQRQRYADLIASSLQIESEGLTTREVFETRAKVISSVRRFLEDHGYIEVETPMLTPKATGAAAKPFETHHNALDITLYARIAPELYLKRLVVGGFEKVYELNRNFRNEGISFKHNPEFTMLEFYCAYMDVNGMMDFAEELLRKTVKAANSGSLQVKISGKKRKGLYADQYVFKRDTSKDRIIDFSLPFKRLSMVEAIADSLGYFKEVLEAHVTSRFEDWLWQGANVSAFTEWVWWALDDFDNEISRDKLEFGLEVSEEYIRTETSKKLAEFITTWKAHSLDERERTQEIVSLFEAFFEATIDNPVFIVDYPKFISPLAKASPENPQIAERFELFINGMEVANGFSELNDPKEQYERFVDQMSERERGDEEAMLLDEDYIRALSYGMPPAAGIGIGIDRLVMLLTNKHSIRDVILFPHLRPERKQVVDEE